ncbi:hypothetical protein QJS10_CPB19g00105 [Acorus calamus]|uniref:Uncharacterized protein n=1 Tax=Acorus calamus TaxID=4465 RepID=A0AAV9CET0_ACOCL|nr:hypothetical protein QJS10_CPB19g00105 [Acorus calamus]
MEVTKIINCKSLLQMEVIQDREEPPVHAKQNNNSVCACLCEAYSANFPSLESLVARIHKDREIVEKSIDLPAYACYEDARYLKSASHLNNCRETNMQKPRFALSVKRVML